MRRPSLFAVLAALVLAAPLSHGGPPAQAQSCGYTLGFAALHDLIPLVVGDCVTDAAYAPNGDALQTTTRGLLAWRKADNWTAFTDGATTWINGPSGVQSRPNDRRFDWEGSAGGAAGQVPGDHPLLALYYAWYDPDSFGNASEQPATQPYQSDDPALIREQVKQAQAAGIGGFVSAWFGQGDRTDKNLTTLLGIAQQAGFGATIYFETDHFGGADEVARQLGNFYRDHLDHPALVRYRGKPVLLFWRTGALDAGAWADIRARVDPGRRAVWIAEGDPVGQLAGDSFDGLHLYSIAWSHNPAATLAGYAAKAHAYPGKLWVPTAMPGYDDTRLGRPNGFAVPRQGGAFYRASLQGALDSGPDWAILIASWNEWLEGHQIEPSASYGSLYLDLTRDFAAKLAR